MFPHGFPIKISGSPNLFPSKPPVFFFPRKTSPGAFAFAAQDVTAEVKQVMGPKTEVITAERRQFGGTPGERLVRGVKTNRVVIHGNYMLSYYNDMVNGG